MVGPESPSYRTRLSFLSLPTLAMRHAPHFYKFQCLNFFQICAFPNTPKFRDVKGLGGKIVKKDWLEVCHRDRKRYPWRRFCLDTGDKGQESEEEVWADDLMPSTSSALATNTIGMDENMDTDEEIEKVQRESKESLETKVKTETYDMDTDEEIEKLQRESKKSPETKVKTEEYDMDTDDEIESIKRKPSESPAKLKDDRSKKTSVKSEYELDTDEEVDNIKRKSDKTNINPDDIDSDVDYNADTGMHKTKLLTCKIVVYMYTNLHVIRLITDNESPCPIRYLSGLLKETVNYVVCRFGL